LLAKNQNLSNQLDSLKDTNTRLIDYVKSINKKVGTANSGKEFSEITAGKSWYEDLLDHGLKSTLTVCPSVLSNFKYWGTRP
jgi:hypothetical protein